MAVAVAVAVTVTVTVTVTIYGWCVVLFDFGCWA